MTAKFEFQPSIFDSSVLHTALCFQNSVRLKKLQIMGLALALCTAAWSSGASQANAKDIDSKNSEPARKDANFLKNMASGNERSGGFDSMVLNTNDRTISGKTFVRRRNRIRTPIGRQTIYDWEVNAKFCFDLDDRHGDPTIDFSQGIKVKVQDLARIMPAL